MSDLASLKTQLDRIERALVGDEAMGQPGLVDRVGGIEVRVGSIEQARRDEANQKRGAIWVFTAIGTVAGSIGAFIAWIIGLLDHAPKQ